MNRTAFDMGDHQGDTSGDTPLKISQNPTGGEQLSCTYVLYDLHSKLGSVCAMVFGD